MGTVLVFSRPRLGFFYHVIWRPAREHHYPHFILQRPFFNPTRIRNQIFSLHEAFCACISGTVLAGAVFSQNMEGLEPWLIRNGKD